MNRKIFNLSFRDAQGMLEGILAIGIILVGLGAILTLTLKNIAATTDSGQKITAIHLAREAIDVVRGIRDSNWLAASNSDPDRVWDEGLSSLMVGEVAIITWDNITPAFTVDFVNGIISDIKFKMYRHINQYYWQQSISDLSLDSNLIATGFNRLTTIDPVCKPSVGDRYVNVGQVGCLLNDTKIGLKVTASITWPGSGFFGGRVTRSLSLVEYLYNWR